MMTSYDHVITTLSSSHDAITRCDTFSTCYFTVIYSETRCRLQVSYLSKLAYLKHPVLSAINTISVYKHYPYVKDYQYVPV